MEPLPVERWWHCYRFKTLACKFILGETMVGNKFQVDQVKLIEFTQIQPSFVDTYRAVKKYFPTSWFLRFLHICNT